MAARVANSTALRFSTGNAPGQPRHTGHTRVLGVSPKRVEQEQKILVAVRSWTWTSSPMTGSYLARAATEMSDVVAISSDYKAGSGLYGIVCSTSAGLSLISRARSDISPAGFRN